MTDRDRISELPDSLLTQILSYLETRDSVRTSLLSKRWELLWLMVSGVDLRYSDFPDCSVEVFVNKFLDSNRQSRMQKFNIIVDGPCDSEFSPELVREWIGSTLDRGIEQLDVATYSHFMMPQAIYRSNTLVSLKLDTVGMESPGFVVSLPCLKILHLKSVKYCEDPLIIEKLISGCPVLEELRIYMCSYCWDKDSVLCLCVKSHTLKSFDLIFLNVGYGDGYSVEIEAPRLEYLSLYDESDVIVVKNLTSLSTINISTDFNTNYVSLLDPEILRKRNIIRDFLTGVSSVRRMIISSRTLKVLSGYSNFRPIPEFGNLYHLEATFSSGMLEFFLFFLESCPNLKNLVVSISVSKNADQEAQLSYVPRCLSSTLEYVEIKEVIRGEETGARIVDYFRENSAVLVKLSVSYKDSPMTALSAFDI